MKLWYKTLVIAPILLLFSANLIWSQSSFQLSKNADFSSDDRVFESTDVLYMKIVASTVDFLNIDKNEFELQAQMKGDKFEGAFENALDFTYTASFSLRNLNSSQENWLWKARIRDDQGNEFNAEVELSILGGVKQDVIKITGAIESLGEDFIVVKNTKLFVDEATSIQAKNNGNLAFADLRLGQIVKVQAVKQMDGSLLALTVEVNDRAKGEVKTTGLIEEVGADYVKVLGQKFLVNDSTRIQDEDKNPIALTDLTQGDLVEIKAKQQPDGTLLARQIKLKTGEESEVELTGFIESIVEDTVTVSGIAFVVNEDTEILDEKKNAVSLSDLFEGLLVEIHARRQEDGSLLATRIKVESEVPGEDEIEVTGKIMEISDGQIVVSDFIFLIDENTKIQDDHKRQISIADLKVDMLVEVKAAVQVDGSFLALKIKIEDRLRDEIEMTGVVEAISLEDSTIAVNGLTFEVDENTEIFGHKKTALEFGDLQVGETVKIRAVILADGTQLAVSIKIEKKDKNEIEVKGTISALGASGLTVSDIEFLVDAHTEILDNQKNPISLGDLQLEQFVEVKAVKQDDGSFLAVRIKVEDRFEDEVEVKGTIQALTTTSITVAGITFKVTENTVVLDNSKNPIPFSSLTTEQFVQVRGELLPGGTLVALKIKLEDLNPNQLEVKGPIDSLDASSVYVLGIKLTIDGNTEILDKKKNPISFSELTAGQFVEVRAEKQPDGSFLATRIKVEDVRGMSGVLSNLGQNSFAIFGASLIVDENTLVLGPRNAVLSFADLVEGQLVETRAVKQDDGSLLVSKIRTLSAGAITSVPGSQTPVPFNFSLEQNYPNPFNPTTTIIVNLSDNIARQFQIRLTVYNILGQTVRTLLQQPLQPGTHQIRWDGKDEFGNPMPSGVYLYQLQAGTFSETRRMVLMK